MKPWTYQKGLRDSIGWILEEYKKNPNINWVPWAITSGNNGSRFNFPPSIASKMFNEFRESGLMDYVPTGNNTAIFTITNEDKVKEFSENYPIFDTKIKPFFFWLVDHRITAMVVALFLFLAGAFLTPWVTNYSEYMYKKCGLPHTEQLGNPEQ